MDTTSNEPALEALAARVAALERALASLQPQPPAPPWCVCRSATSGVPAVQATGTNGATGVNASSDTGVGLITQSGAAVGLLAVGGGAPLPAPGSQAAIVAAGGPSYGLFAHSDGDIYSPAVYGQSPSGTGAAGQSGSGLGVVGQSDSGDGVTGESASGDGVVGYSDSGTGVFARSARGIGLHAVGAGASPTVPSVDAAVFAEGGPGVGLLATSDADDAVLGMSTYFYGVAGQSGTSYGVSGFSV